MKKGRGQSLGVIQRHVSILELLGQGKSSREIEAATGLDYRTVYNTIYNQSGKLEHLRQILRERGVEDSKEIHQEVVEETREATRETAGENQDLIELYHRLLADIYGEPYVKSKSSMSEIAERLGFDDVKHFQTILDALTEGGFLKRNRGRFDSKYWVYQVTEMGEPYVTGQLRIELQANEEAQEGTETEESTESQAGVEEQQAAERTNEEHVELWTNLLESIFWQNYEHTEQNRDELIEKFGFRDAEDFDGVLGMLTTAGFLEEQHSRKGGGISTYYVTPAGKPFATRQEKLEVQSSTEAQESVEGQDGVETEDQVEKGPEEVAQEDVETEAATEERGEQDGEDAKQERLLEEKRNEAKRDLLRELSRVADSIH